MKKQMISFVAVASLPLLCGAGGCATIVSGRQAAVMIQSKPSGATASIDGYGTFKTPATVKVDRNHAHTVVLTYPGLPERQVALKQTINGWIFGNILFGGIIGIIVDAATGSANNLTPDEFVVDMNTGEVGKIPSAEAKQLKEELAADAKKNAQGSAASGDESKVVPVVNGEPAVR